MRSYLLLACAMLAAGVSVRAQDTAVTRTLTMEEYEKAKTFSVGDPDKDTYVKFENVYILDHDAFGKPYFITGDDGKKKRIDLYKLILKDGRIELGTIIYYTTETGKRYTACMPGYKADAKVWRKYFEDIHAIDKDEPFFVMKLSYVLSEELGYQLYRAGQPGSGTAVSREVGTYGNDICFPGDMEVTMAGGMHKLLKDVKAGDAIVTVDPVSRKTRTVPVKELTVHEEKNYAITRLVLLSAVKRGDRDVNLSSRVLKATPNHPMGNGKTAGELNIGDKVWCAGGKGYKMFTVWDKSETAGRIQHVYNIVAGAGSTMIINGVMVSQK
jgi:hypothetical protein